MWILILLFGLVSLALGWTLFGYFLLLWLVGLFRAQRKPALPASLPMLTMIVPCYNEEELILEKLKNIRAADYPRDRLEVIFVDGGSTDRTVALLKEAIADDPACRLVSSPVKGKIGQLNAALPQARGEIIVNSDVDAMLEPDTLRWLAAEFAASKDVGVVGAYCCPAPQANVIDRYHWDAQNRGRFLESRAGMSSIVVAPCYAFRRGLLGGGAFGSPGRARRAPPLDRFPDDVVADDIYVAFLCGCQGQQTVYSRWAKAVEMRNPTTLGEFLPHKFRKANAFLRESLRFLYRLPEMGSLFKIIFLTRIGQLLLLPWLGIAWCLLAGALLTSWPVARYDVVGVGAAMLLVLFLCTTGVFRTIAMPGEPQRFGFLTILRGYILTNLLLLTTALSYPFYRQGSAYARIVAEPSVRNDAEKKANGAT